MRGISRLASNPVSFSRRTLLHGLSKQVSKYELIYILLSVVVNFVPMEYVMYCIALILHSVALSSVYPWMSCVFMRDLYTVEIMAYPCLLYSL